MRGLTEAIRDGLADAAPDFETVLDAVEMRRAADVALRSHRNAPLAEVSLAEREQLAKDLDRLPEERRDPIARAAAEYELVLGAVRADDRHLAAGQVKDLAVGGSWPPALRPAAGPVRPGRHRREPDPHAPRGRGRAMATAPVSKGTNRALVGFITFPAMWIALGVRRRAAGCPTPSAPFTWPLSPEIEWVFGSVADGAPRCWCSSRSPIFGLLAVWLAEQITRLYRTWRAVSTSVNRHRLKNHANVLPLTNTISSY